MLAELGYDGNHVLIVCTPPRSTRGCESLSTTVKQKLAQHDVITLISALTMAQGTPAQSSHYRPAGPQTTGQVWRYTDLMDCNGKSPPFHAGPEDQC